MELSKNTRLVAGDQSTSNKSKSPNGDNASSKESWGNWKDKDARKDDKDWNSKDWYQNSPA